MDSIVDAVSLDSTSWTRVRLSFLLEVNYAMMHCNSPVPCEAIQRINMQPSLNRSWHVDGLMRPSQVAKAMVSSIMFRSEKDRDVLLVARVDPDLISPSGSIRAPPSS
jgi:hypothetical protein